MTIRFAFVGAIPFLVSFIDPRDPLVAGDTGMLGMEKHDFSSRIRFVLKKKVSYQFSPRTMSGDEFFLEEQPQALVMPGTE
jgi:hypothetical protein